MVTNLLACPLMLNTRVCTPPASVSWAKTFADIHPAGAGWATSPYGASMLDRGIGSALRAELAARMKTCPTIAAMSPTKLNRLCKLHGSERRQEPHVYDGEDGPQRAAILRPRIRRDARLWSSDPERPDGQRAPALISRIANRRRLPRRPEPKTASALMYAITHVHAYE